MRHAMAKATLHDPRRGVTPKPKRGGKANLSPRVPAARKIPRLHTDFATPDVVKPLVLGGWKPRRSDETADRMYLEVKLGPSELDGIPDWGDISDKIPNPVDGPSALDEILDPHDLSNHIGQLVAHYISAAHYQQAPNKFRLEAKEFHKAITGLEAKFPAPGSVLAEALNDEIEKLGHPDAPDIELCRTVVRVLREASERVQTDEAGPGADADRAKHELFRGLARIWEECTGRRPARAFDPIKGKPIGPFFEFVTAVNKKIPRSLRLTHSYIDRLTRTHFPSS
jgi:hypothetical protein